MYPIEKVNKILLLCNRSTFYFYNIPPCYLSDEWAEFIKTNLLYDYHFKPIGVKKTKCPFDYKECEHFDICNKF